VDLLKPVYASVATLVVMSLLSSGHFAASDTIGPKACSANEHRQFDFWVGEWDVYLPSGKKAGENRIAPIAGGCALLEEWSGDGGFTGKSLNIYDANDGQWHQTWVDSSGALLMLAGGIQRKSMIMTSAPEAKGDLQRISWSPAPDMSVRQLWESSADGGRSWTTVFDGRYVRPSQR
jgi:hypothetical protein